MTFRKTSPKAAFASIAVFAVIASCTEQRSRETPPVPSTSTAPAAASTTVAMTPAAIAAAGVATEPVAESTIVVDDELPGTIEAPRDALVTVNARAAGVVESLEFDVGDRVSAGQRLATIRSVELAEAQAAYRRAVVAAQYAATALERSEALRTEGVISQRRLDVDRLETREQQLELEEASARVRIMGGSRTSGGGATSVNSPIAGVIATRTANRGEALAINSPLFTVVDVSQVVVQLRALGGTRAEPGTEVSFTIEGLPERSFTAIVRSASDVIDPETRRFFIRCSVVNTDGVLKPGMFVTAQLPRPGVRALTVPDTAVQVMAGGPAVFVARDGGRFERRSVELGPRADGRVAVERGLVAGEIVVVRGAYWVRTELQRSELEE